VLLRIVVAVVVVGLTTASNSATEAQRAGAASVPVRITVIGCKENRDVKPVLWLRPKFMWSREDVQPQLLNPRGVFEFSLELPPGTHAVRVTTTKFCEAMTSVHLLSGHPRHLTVALSGSILIGEDDHALAGSLPAEAVRVALLNKGY